MRAFRISLVLLLVMGIMMGVGTAYQRRVYDELTALVQALPESPGDAGEAAVEALVKRWERTRRALLPLVCRELVYDVEEMLCDLQSYAKHSEDAGQYGAARRRLLGALENMRRASRGSFGVWS